MDEIKLFEELQHLNETTDQLEIFLQDYDIKKEEEEIAFDLHHSIDIKEENCVLEPELHEEPQTQIKKKSRCKKATPLQMLSIIDFLQKNENYQCNNEDLETGWEALALQVNALGGSSKPAEGWRKTFNEWKSHVRIKLKKGETLSELDQSCADFMECKPLAPSRLTAVKLRLLAVEQNKAKINNTTWSKRVTVPQNEDGEKIKESNGMRVTSGNLYRAKAYRGRRATSKQMSNLLDFIQRHDILHLCTPSQNWETLARQVNSIYGATKTGAKWRKTFVEWKSHIRTKLRNGVILSEQEKRCAQLAGLKTVLPGMSTTEELEFSNEQEGETGNKISRGKKATSRQMSSLLDFMQENENIRVGKGTRDALTASWEALTRQLNAVGGCIKTSKEWKMLYTEWKSYVKFKLKRAKPLSKLEKRCVQIAGLNRVRKQSFLDKHREKMLCLKKASSVQMSRILDFIEQNEDFRIGGATGDKLKTDWETLTLQLNSMGGRTKTAEGWQEAYADWKSHVKMKLKNRKPLTEQDKRCAHLAGITNISNISKLKVPELNSLEEQGTIAKVKKRSRGKRATLTQKVCILDFIQENPNVNWESLSQQVNAVGGSIKTAEGWKKTYIEWKSHVRVKIRKGETLMELDQRFVDMDLLDQQEKVENRATLRQLLSLLDFIQQNENVRFGKGSVDVLNEGWEALSKQVNAVYGITQSAEGWKRTFIEWKELIRTKLQNGRTLSELEKRCAHLAELNLVDLGKPTVKLDKQKKVKKCLGKRASSVQMSSFLDFMEQNEDFRFGKGTTEELRAGWETLTEQLNALGKSTKTMEEWKTLYTKWKCHIRMKINKGENLSEQDQRCADLAGLNTFVCGKSTVRDLGVTDEQGSKNSEDIEKSAQGSRATLYQKSMILDFLQENENVRLEQGSTYVLQAAWEALALQVNATGGASKTTEGWRKAYGEWKSHVRNKLKGGKTLSEQDKRFVDLAELNGVNLGKSKVRKSVLGKRQNGEKKSRNKKATAEQMASFLDYIEQHKDFRLGKVYALDLKAGWDALTQQVNAIIGGSSKTTAEWKRTYIEWKSHIRIKLRKGETLSELDTRCARLTGIIADDFDNSAVQEVSCLDQQEREDGGTSNQMSDVLDLINNDEDFCLGNETVYLLNEDRDALAQQVISTWTVCESHVQEKLEGGEALTEEDKGLVDVEELNRIDLGEPEVSKLGLGQHLNGEKRSRGRRMTIPQMTSFLDYLEQHEDFRLGRGNVNDLNAGWEALTRQVNSMDGSSKTVEGWKKRYTEWKSHIRRKLKRGQYISKLDKRCAHLAGINEGENREQIEIRSSKRTTSYQMSILLDFIEKNENVRLDEGTSEVLGADWEALAEEVNAVGGSTKTAMEWKKAYTEWKFQVLKKLRNGEALSKQDKRCAHLAALYTHERGEIKKKFRNRKATSRQMSSLLDFFQQNDYFRGNGSNDDIRAGWEALTLQVNALGGSNKTVQGWKMLYTQWKSHIRKKLRNGKSLSGLDKRCVQVAGLNRDDFGKSRVRKLGFLVKRGENRDSKKTTLDQLSSLLDFVQENENIRMGKGTTEDLQASWEALTEQVNALAGATKTVKGWKQFYTDWNYHIRKKMKKGVALSRLEKRYIHLTRLDIIALSTPIVKELGIPNKKKNIKVNSHHNKVTQEQLMSAPIVRELGVPKNEEKVKVSFRNRRATPEQMLSLLDFIQENDDLRFGRGTADNLKAAWEDLTQKLNALCGATKKVEGWKKLYTEWKSHIRTKIRKGVALSKREKRCAHLAGINTVFLSHFTVKEVGVRIKQEDREMIKTRSRSKRATTNQMSRLLDFIQENDDFRLGKGTVDDLKKGWEDLSTQLNADAGGAIKTPNEWKKTYTEWKSHVRIKLRKRLKLSAQEMRCANLVLKLELKELDVLDKRKNRDVEGSPSALGESGERATYGKDTVDEFDHFECFPNGKKRKLS